jgi:anti-sigma factor RsiW
MTNDCERARAWMLEAEPAELRGEGSSSLSHHLAGCEGCRRRADAILAGLAELDGALAALARPAEPAKVIPLRRRPAIGWRTVRWAAPLTLAAGAAAVLLGRPAAPAVERPGVTAERIARVLFAPAPVARAADGRSVAVLKTNDPGVTVVWVY